MRVAVIGGNGFLGRALCLRLSRDSRFEVLSVSRTSRHPIPKVESAVCDASDSAVLRSTLRGFSPDALVCLAGHGSGAPRLELMEPTIKSDLLVALNVLTVGTELDCRIVMPSSLEVPSDRATAPASPYAAARSAVDVFSQMMTSVFRSRVVTPRIFMTYGPGQRITKVLPASILGALSGDVVRLGSPHRMVDWIYVDDVVDGLVRCLTVEDADGRSFDLGSGTATSVGEIVRLALEVGGMPGAVVAHATDLARPNEPDPVADIARTAEIIGWEPRTTLRSGLETTIASLRRYRNTPEARSLNGITP